MVECNWVTSKGWGRLGRAKRVTLHFGLWANMNDVRESESGCNLEVGFCGGNGSVILQYQFGIRLRNICCGTERQLRLAGKTTWESPKLPEMFLKPGTSPLHEGKIMKTALMLWDFSKSYWGSHRGWRSLLQLCFLPTPGGNQMKTKTLKIKKRGFWGGGCSPLTATAKREDENKEEQHSWMKRHIKWYKNNCQILSLKQYIIGSDRTSSVYPGIIMSAAQPRFQIWRILPIYIH